jgi:delta24-sterol reductase
VDNLPKYHQNKVARLQEEVRGFYDTKTQVKIFHGSTNSTRSQKMSSGQYVNVSDFDEIIEINTQENYAIVEANVSLDTLLKETLKYRLIPLVVSEFPGITIGGAVQGGAGESSSFRYGCLHNTCLEYELVTAQGAAVTASPHKNKDLFTAVPCSYGSIAILTCIKLKLMPSSKTVDIEYRRVDNYGEALQLIKTKTEARVEYVDAIMFSAKSGVVITGTFTEDINLPLKTFHKATDEWFYIHAEKVAKEHSVYHEATPITDYLFRYDRGAFWTGKYGYKIYHIPFNRFTRFWFSSLMKTRTLYRYLHGAGISQEFIIQDICLPYESVPSFLRYVDEKLQIHPLWLCPLKVDPQHNLSPTNIQSELVINVGIWGELKKDYQGFVAENKKMEHMLSKLGGRKVLYAHTYYSENEFWQNYDRKLYDDVRSKYEAPILFPDIYKKVVVTKQMKRSLLRGWLALVRSPY